MKKILILGGGTDGTMMSNKLRNSLDREEWKITVIDREKTHYYQPGLLFILFGIYNRDDVIKPKMDFYPPGVNVVFSEIERILPEKNQVILADNTHVNYDILIIATGAHIRPDQTLGLLDGLW